MQNLLATFIFLTSSGYVILLDYFAFSPRSLQKTLVLPVILLLFIIYRTSLKSWKGFLSHQGKWFFLFWGAILVQTLLISTGGLHSPFFILLHIFMIGVSFIFSFSISLIFLFFSFVVIFADISFSQNVISFFITDPGKYVLQIVSFISIIPFSYIISRQYHIKEMLLPILRVKVTTAETILESLDELIIVTDSNFNIISVNDAVERALQKSRSEVLHVQLFEALLLKNQDGKLTNNETFFPQGDTTKQPIKTTDKFTIVNSALTQREVTIQVQIAKDIESNIQQISFILDFTNFQSARSNSGVTSLEKAKVRYGAIIENLKKKLLNEKLFDIEAQVILLEKIESDIFVANNIESMTSQQSKSRIDLARLSKKVVMLEQDFANAFQVPLIFELRNFGQKDIEHLTVTNFPVTPEQLTGPFFTVAYDVKQSEKLIKKLIDISIFLSSTISDSTVKCILELGSENNVIVKIHGTCPQLTPEDVKNLSTPYYGSLMDKTNLDSGSGLEGFIAKKMSELLNIPIDIGYEPGSTNITFTLIFKKPEEVSMQGQ